jgi:hypothetical protein
LGNLPDTGLQLRIYPITNYKLRFSCIKPAPNYSVEIETMDEKGTHFTFEQLADYVDGRLTAAESTRLEMHLAADCAACQGEVAWLRQTTAVMAEEWEAPNKAVRANVVRAFRHYVPANGQEEAPKPHRVPTPWFQRLFQHRLRLATALFAVALLLLVSGRFYQGWAQDVIQNSAILVELSGTAEYQLAGTDSWLPLTKDIFLVAGDKVRTGENGSIGLQFFENNTTYLGPDTHVEIIAFSVRRDGRERVITLEQRSGQSYSSGWPPGEEITYLSVRTPEAVVAVQALGYDLVIDTASDTEISVIKGCAEIVSYDAATQTSYRQQTGSSCIPNQSEPIAPDNEIVPAYEL